MPDSAPIPAKAKDAPAKLPLPGTIVIHVNSSPHCPALIKICCEELVFVGGAKYDWPQKSVTIRCRTLSLIPDAAGTPVEFSLVGADSGDPPGKAATAASHRDMRAQTHPDAFAFKFANGDGSSPGYWIVTFDIEKPGSRRLAQEGDDGEKDVPGQKSGAAGCFTLFAEKVDASMTSAAGCMWDWRKFLELMAGKDEEQIKKAEQLKAFCENSTAVPTRASEPNHNHREGERLWELYSPPVDRPPPKDWKDLRQPMPKVGEVAFKDATSASLHQAYTNEALFLQKIHGRLSFKHFVYVTAQPYAWADEETLAAVARLKSSGAWTMRIFADADAKDERPILKVFKLAFQTLFQACSAEPPAEAYQHSVS
ncbi:hypothetical protein CDEST_11842 [Colletotrichum destructivum]|uniref:Uncharacterized protein n=1 Tax=Colletotrichum destructivum TaxID=34406 RepID=A0AAX4IUJ4_9PEZI|nr:hypothetical protein CDEST_11842 [Colletotrichum destructivum]